MLTSATYRVNLQPWTWWVKLVPQRLPCADWTLRSFVVRNQGRLGQRGYLLGEQSLPAFTRGSRADSPSRWVQNGEV